MGAGLSPARCAGACGQGRGATAFWSPAAPGSLRCSFLPSGLVGRAPDCGARRGGPPCGGRSPASSQLCPLQQAEPLCSHLENGRVPGSGVVTMATHCVVKRQKFITSKLCRLEVQGRGVGRLVLSEGPEGEAFQALSQRLAASGILRLWMGVFARCVSVSSRPLCVRTLVILG